MLNIGLERTKGNWRKGDEGKTLQIELESKM